MFCRECGKQSPVGATVCESCGYRMVAAVLR